MPSIGKILLVWTVVSVLIFLGGVSSAQVKKDKLSELLTKEMLQKAAEDRDAAEAHKGLVDGLLAEFDDLAREHRPPFYQLEGDALYRQEEMLAEFEAEIFALRVRLAEEMNVYLDDYDFEVRFIAVEGALEFTDQLRETLRYKFVHPLEGELIALRQAYVAEVTPLLAGGDGGWLDSGAKGGHFDWGRLFWTAFAWATALTAVGFSLRRYIMGKPWRGRLQMAGESRRRFPWDYWSFALASLLLLFCIIATVRGWGCGGELGTLMLGVTLVLYSEWRNRRGMGKDGRKRAKT